MGKIVAIGGGEMAEGETLLFDRRIIELTGKSRPRALFIPTASADASEYQDIVQRVYGGDLGCEVEMLLLLADRPSTEAIAARIAAADLIYVGGGNTLRMMKLWRKLGVDALLEQAFHRGTVLSGISAGAICWCAYGHSDSRSFAATDDRWDYIRVRGMGLVDAIFCPHLDEDTRRPDFTRFMGKYGQMGIGLENHCALEIVDDQYRLLTARKGAQAYRIYLQRGTMITETIEQHEDYRPLDELLKK